MPVCVIITVSFTAVHSVSCSAYIKVAYIYCSLKMMLLTTVCLLLFLSHARAQGCAEIMITDLGSTDTAGTGGAIAGLFSGGET